MPRNKVITKSFSPAAEDYPSSNLIEFFEWLAERVDEIPLEFRSKAEIYFTEYDGDKEIDIKYERPLTQTDLDKEAADKQAQEQRQREVAEKHRKDSEKLLVDTLHYTFSEESQRSIYEKLKAKFEGQKQ